MSDAKKSYVNDLLMLTILWDILGFFKTVCSCYLLIWSNCEICKYTKHTNLVPDYESTDS